MSDLRFVRVGKEDCEVGFLMRGSEVVFLAIPEEHTPRTRPLSLFVLETELEIVFDVAQRTYVGLRWTPALDRPLAELVNLLQSLRIVAVTG